VWGVSDKCRAYGLSAKESKGVHSVGGKVRGKGGKMT
jgi:hypothetical protein